MNRPSFKSAFAGEIDVFLDYRQATGICIDQDILYLKKLDAFLEDNKIPLIGFDVEVSALWRSRRDVESDHGHYMRINFTKRFFEFLFVKGYKVALLRDVRPPKSNFVPHIYTDDEIDRYFQAVDAHNFPGNPKNKIQLPVLFRLLYSCGLRVTETLMIKMKDVDLEEGIIRLRITKGSKERYAVLSESMHILLREYADKTFYLLGEDDFIFSNRRGSALRCDWLEEIHNRLLYMAGIPSASASGSMKRLHDWRHTHAVGAFKQMVERGYDMYVALPILSAYMGHISITATERYLRLAVNLYPYLQKKFDAALEDVFGKEVHYED
jgi:integrase/recombinase XerD